MNICGISEYYVTILSPKMLNELYCTMLLNLFVELVSTNIVLDNLNMKVHVFSCVKITIKNYQD